MKVGERRMILETERLILRTWEKTDVDVLYELAQDEHVGPPCGWSPHKDIRESEEILENILMNDYTYAIVLKETGQVIGDISLMPNSESKYCENDMQAEIGFWLGFPYWGRGYMPEACTSLIRYGFEERKLEKIVCSHNIENQNSRRVQEKCGFKYLYTDTYYSKRLEKEISMIVNGMTRNENKQ